MMTRTTPIRTLRVVWFIRTRIIATPRKRNHPNSKGSPWNFSLDLLLGIAGGHALIDHLRDRCDDTLKIGNSGAFRHDTENVGMVGIIDDAAILELTADLHS